MKTKARGNTLTKDDLTKTWRSSAFQVFQIAQCFDSKPINPTIAAHLSFVFQDTKDTNTLRSIKSWLFNYIEPFAISPPREQSDLPDKSLAIAIYLDLQEYTRDYVELSTGGLIDYLEYAEKQNWFDDPFLAFYCTRLESHIIACKTAKEYLLHKIDKFITRNNFVALCQAVTGCASIISPEQALICSKFLQPRLQNHNDLSLNELSWGLWASHALDNSRELHRDLSETIDNRLADYATRLVKAYDLYSRPLA